MLDRVMSKNDSNILTVIGFDHVEGKVICNDGVNTKKFLASDLSLFSSYAEKSKFDHLKMYVVVDRECPVGLGINGMVHVAYAAGHIFAGECIQNECIVEYNADSITYPEVDEWQRKSYRNVSVVGDTFDILEAMRVCDELKIPCVAFHEPDWLEANGRPLAVAFYPQYVWPEVFSKFELHSGTIKRFGNTRT